MYAFRLKCVATRVRLIAKSFFDGTLASIEILLRVEVR